jgi:Family of unknown function (DUF6326)
MHASSTATMELEDVKVMEKEKTMHAISNVTRELEDIKVPVKLKLAALWASLMFFIIYLDYFHLYMPGKLEDILAGKVFVFDITQGFLVAAIAIVGIPALMIFLSVALPAKVSRWANIIIAAVNIPLILFNLAGEVWVHMVFGAVVEVALLCLIIWYAWKWPAAEPRLGSVPIFSTAQSVGAADLRRQRAEMPSS